MRHGDGDVRLTWAARAAPRESLARSVHQGRPRTGAEKAASQGGIGRRRRRRRRVAVAVVAVVVVVIAVVVVVDVVDVIRVLAAAVAQEERKGDASCCCQEEKKVRGSGADRLSKKTETIATFS